MTLPLANECEWTFNAFWCQVGQFQTIQTKFLATENVNLLTLASHRAGTKAKSKKIKEKNYRQ